MDLIDEIDHIVINGRDEKDVKADLCRYIRRAVLPLSLFELQKTEFLIRDWNILEHVLEKSEQAKAVFGKEILDAASLIKLGNLSFCKNDLPKAQDLYRRATKVQPLPVAFKNLGVALLSDGKPVEAREFLEEAAKGDAKDFQTWFYLGLTWEAVAEGRSKTPDGVMAITSLEKSQVDIHLKKALEYYDQSLELEPKFGPALYNKSVVLTLLGRKEEARDVITKMLEGQPASEAGWIARGLILRASEDHEGALKCYENAIIINQDSHVAWLNKSVVLFILKRLEEALVAADRALELNQISEIAWSNKGAVLSELGRFKEAIECYDKAIELNPNFEGSKKNRAKALEDMKKATPKKAPPKANKKPRKPKGAKRGRKTP
jgi:tetratricopeptide (TPR) repeat protein